MIPLEFFERILPVETATTIKVVGTVIRHTVGYATKCGRRSQAPLSYSFIQRYAHIKHRPLFINHLINAGTSR